METSKNIKYYNELEDEGHFDLPETGRRRLAMRDPRRVPVAIEKFVQNQDDSCKTFTFTYKAARFEEGWLLDSLGYFYEQHWISDVLRKVKAGKEASVYLCRSGEHVEAPLVAAKVYRPRMLRNLKNDQLYRDGRASLDEDGNRISDQGMLRAQKKRSVYGEQIRHQSWIAYEYTALQTLHAAGADVPRPYEMARNAILMGYIGDEEVPAPALNEIRLERPEAAGLFDRLLRNVILLLQHQWVHGDLSAYNVLYWQGDVFLIDFPQVISPQANRNAYAIFERDMSRLCDYFISLGLDLRPRDLAADLWRANGHHLSPPGLPALRG